MEQIVNLTVINEPLTAQRREHHEQQNVCMCAFTLLLPLAFHRSMNYHTPLFLLYSHPINEHVASAMLAALYGQTLINSK